MLYGRAVDELLTEGFGQMAFIVDTSVLVAAANRDEPIGRHARPSWSTQRPRWSSQHQC